MNSVYKHCIQVKAESEQPIGYVIALSVSQLALEAEDGWKVSPTVTSSGPKAESTILEDVWLMCFLRPLMMKAHTFSSSVHTLENLVSSI